jgi:very-short-patch-repair endonuclease
MKNAMSTAEDNLVKALDYLLYLDKLRAAAILTLTDHRLPVFHEHEFQGLPGIETNLTDGATEVWLQVRRLRAQPPPQPEPFLALWLDLPNDPVRHPLLAEHIELGRRQVPAELATRLPPLAPGADADSRPGRPERPNGPEVEPMAERLELRLDDFPEVRERFSRYLNQEWTPWAEQEAPKRRSIKLYDRLFSLLQDAEVGGSEEGAIEVAWGVGLALWDHKDSGKRINYPIISRTVEIHVEETSMALRVLPTEREPEVHVDGFKEIGIESADLLHKRARTELDAADRTLSPLDPESFQGILRFAAGHLDTQGVYWPDAARDVMDRQLPQPQSHLIVTDGWVIFARKRSTSFIAADVERLKQAVQTADELPAAATLIVTEPPNENAERQLRRYRGLCAFGGIGDTAARTEDAGDLYFPKPFNAEQVKIIEQLDHAPGVVVQGPPGTGKTHTIANIICHYLALGKRVLVTAQHEAPLAVLQEQIPEALRPLTISLLTSEREGLRQLEQAVRKIADKTRQLDVHALERDVKSEMARIDRLHQRLAAIDQELRAMATSQTSATPFFGASLQPEDLARRVVASAETHQWFPDQLAGDDSTLPGFKDADIDELRAARLRLGNDLCYLDCRIPDTAMLPLADDIAALHGELIRLGEVQRLVDAPGAVPALREYSVAAIARLQSLRERVIDVQNHLQVADRAAWAFVARPLLASTTGPVGQHIKRWVKETLDLEKARQALLGDAVEIPAEAQTSAALYQAVKNAADGKRPFPLLRGDNAAKSAFRQVTRHGVPPTSTDDWKPVLSHLDNVRWAAKLAATWDQLRQEFDGPPSDGNGLGAVRGMYRHAQALLALWRVDERLAGPLAAQVEEVFANATDFVDATQGLTQMQRLLDAVDTHLEHSRLRSAQNTVAAVREQFVGCSGPVVDDAKRLLLETIGLAAIPADEARTRWQAIVSELRRVAALHGDLASVQLITQQIAESGATRWADVLRAEIVDAEWDSWLPVDWRSAWEWSRARGYLDAIGGRERLMRLSQERLSVEADLRSAYVRVVELRTWGALAELPPAISAALNAYLAAVTRIGAATGIRTTRYRRDAREAMSKAYGATPCWIMAHWRVSEALPARLGLFDLVVIDEASQSDIRALPAILRAKKLLIVGDDKQVSPSDVGVKETDIVELRTRFLSTFPYPQHFLPGSSIYDLGSTMFASAVIRLREHFRCVEPIIAFSNRHFYDGEIRPLRIPKPSERLDPPLVDVYVRGGYRKGKSKLNKPEADAIVAEIKQLTADPTIGERSIGVVSLLGAEQAKYIQDRLLETLGEERFIRHRIRCGDAMHFQGKEADIVLVSMVDAGRITAATGRVYEQRYNVACSRARDRLYVFHSFAREQLKDSDLRAKVLDHLARPLGDTQVLAADLRTLCESDFEREVFDALVQRGYRVVPQVRAGGFRIDLVVEGADDRRLAIECDGDRYHGVEQWIADVERQRVLERMGWHFWRCWASSWVAEQDACLAELIDTLDGHGISAWSTDSGAVPTSLAEHRIVEPESDEESAEDEPRETNAADTVRIAPAAAPEPPEPALARAEATPIVESAAVDDLSSGRCVELNDIVDYVQESKPEQRLSVSVVSGVSQPRYGVVNQHTPLGSALLGATPGDVVEVRLPHGIELIKIVGICAPGEISQARRSASEAR